MLVVLSLFAEVLSTDKPLVVRYEGQTYFPVLRDYSEKTFGGDFETPADYLDPFIRERITHGRQLGDLRAQPLRPEDAQLLRQVAEPGARRRARTCWAPTTAAATCWRS